MTKDDNSLKTVVKMEKERHGRQRGQKKDKVKAPTKIIIRHLPPTMTEAEFLKQTEPMPAHDFYYYVPADWSLGFDATCRAYITLKNYDDVFLFRDRFDGYVFVDGKGVEYPAIVEFAPFQGLAKNKSRRSDNKMNTIEEEAHYQQFLIKLKEERETVSKGLDCKWDLILDRKKDDKNTSTPLLQYLAMKKEKRREDAKKRMEEKRRQRDDDKDKRRQQVTRIMTGRDADKRDVKGQSGSRENIAVRNENAQEEHKNSRMKRRAVRDQRRREEHEQRKKEKEREQKEQQKGTVTGPDAVKPAVEDASHSDGKQLESVQKGEDPRQRRNERRYSERRERERNRKRNQKDNDKTAVAGNENASVKVDTITPISNDVGVNDVVKNFILSVAKEFVPKHKQLELEASKKQEHTGVAKEDTADKKDQPQPQPRKNSLVEDEKRGEKEQKRNDNQSIQRQRSNEERRIRNKDRPSIAIYQPKARLRLNEESEAGGTGKNVRNNSTSECEPPKKDEERGGKKVSRYSERRAERRALKQKSTPGDVEDDTQIERRRGSLRKSKSCDDDSGANNEPTARAGSHEN